jgi:hypothetical protein
MMVKEQSVTKDEMRRVNRILAVAASTLLLLGVGCGGGSSSHTNSNTTSNTNTNTGANVQPITVNAGPDGNYANGAFTSVTVCTPGTTTCQTIDGVLVDTGSSGLRILSSALTSVTLPQQKAASGAPVVECLPFVSGYTWGPVESADIQIAGEKATSVPVQVINQTAYPVPTACSNWGPSQDSTLGANGILGVGIFAQDCGEACVSTGTSNHLYYECPKSGCVAVGEALSQQVANPVALFSSDNNGVIIELPAAPNPEATLSGSLIFGIGTQSNNTIGSATKYGVDNSGNFTTIFKSPNSSTSQSYSSSFLDSGSNGLFFLTAASSGIPDCADANFFYCPTSALGLSAVNQGAGGVGSGTVNFSVANADSLFNNFSNDTVLGDLAGPNTLAGFDWGLPFFYGRNVFTAIEGKSTPAGVGPYWAY